MVHVNSKRAAEDTYVLDEANGLRLWLDAKVKAHEITPAQAVDALRQQETNGKLWTGPVKDAFGSAKIGLKLARDFEHMWKARVSFVPGKTGDLVIIKGWPNAREVLTGTRYKVTNPKIMELQIGKPGIRAAAKESARFGVILVVAVDVAEFVASHDLAKLLGSLTVDIPSVILASAIGSAAGALAAGTLVIGSFAFGPLLVAFGVGVLAGYALFKLDEAFGITEKVTKVYESALEELKRLWDKLGAEAEKKFREFENSRTVRYIGQGVNTVEQWFNSSMRRLGEGNNAQYMLQSLM
ncbi:MAG: hypothetical protein ACRYG4_01975 [Janthinobacterium lividum]